MKLAEMRESARSVLHEARDRFQADGKDFSDLMPSSADWLASLSQEPVFKGRKGAIVGWTDLRIAPWVMGKYVRAVLVEPTRRKTASAS